MMLTNPAVAWESQPGAEEILVHVHHLHRRTGEQSPPDLDGFSVFPPAVEGGDDFVQNERSRNEGWEG